MRASVIFLLLIPAFIALGHDFYLFYNEHLNPGVFSIDLLKKEFKFSALGFIWTTYDEASYKSVVESTAPETWATIDSLLTIKAFYAGLAFAGIFTAFFLILKLFGKGPFVNEEAIYMEKSSKDVSFRAGSQSKKMQYKRK
ncbi:MAG: hypothetical protein H6859_08890 [Rhodospirillales bacterium]|nr:hypothetical protein [Alphaproteobacteria bacterium]USO05255.1 MAG: hypothetical protein H6859_08890 [Rhodospirillales bacterium]